MVTHALLLGNGSNVASLTGQSLNDDRGLIALRDTVLKALERHAEGKQADDDITFVLCQFDPPARSRTVSGTGAGFKKGAA